MDANAEAEDRSGDSVFFKDPAGEIFHTYSTFGAAARSSSGPTGISMQRRKAATRMGLTIHLPTGFDSETCTADRVWWKPMDAIIQEGALAPCTIQQPAEAEVIGAPVEVLGAVVA